MSVADEGYARRPLCDLNGAEECRQSPLPYHQAGTAKAGHSGCTLSDLCAEDKRKVAKLIRRVVEAEQHVQEVAAQAQEEACSRQNELEQLRARGEEAAREAASLRAKLARALSLLRTYQARLRAMNSAAAAAAAAATPLPPPQLPAACSAGEAAAASKCAAVPAKSGPEAVAEAPCPTCRQGVEALKGLPAACNRAGCRVGAAAAAPVPGDALADLAASLLAWQLRQGATAQEGLETGLGSEPGLVTASKSGCACAPGEPSGASGSGKLRFDPLMGRSGAFYFDGTGVPRRPLDPEAYHAHEPGASGVEPCDGTSADHPKSSQVHADDGQGRGCSDRSDCQPGEGAPTAAVHGPAGALHTPHGAGTPSAPPHAHRGELQCPDPRGAAGSAAPSQGGTSRALGWQPTAAPGQAGSQHVPGARGAAGGAAGGPGGGSRALNWQHGAEGPAHGRGGVLQSPSAVRAPGGAACGQGGGSGAQGWERGAGGPAPAAAEGCGGLRRDVEGDALAGTPGHGLAEAGANPALGPALTLNLPTDNGVAAHAADRAVAAVASLSPDPPAADRAAARFVNGAEAVAAEAVRQADQGPSARGPAAAEPGMDASLLDLVAEVERLQAAAGALGCSPAPAAAVQRWSADPATHVPAREPASRGDFCRQWVHSGGRLSGDAWDSASLFEENDVMSLISEQEWDMRR